MNLLKKNLDKEYIEFLLKYSILSISLDEKKVKLTFFSLNILTKFSGKIKLSLNIFSLFFGKNELSLLPIKFIICFILFLFTYREIFLKNSLLFEKCKLK